MCIRDRTYTAEALADDVSFTSGIYVEVAEMMELIDLLRHMEPAGLGAKNLQDCLLLQLERRQEPDAILARDLVKKHFDDLEARSYEKLMKGLGINANQLKDCLLYTSRCV